MFKRVLIVVLAVVAVAAAATFAVASIPDSNGVIHTCYKVNGVLHVINYPTENCTVHETALNWSQSSPFSKAAYATIDTDAGVPFLDTPNSGMTGSNAPSAGHFCIYTSFTPVAGSVVGGSSTSLLLASDGNDPAVFSDPDFCEGAQADVTSATNNTHVILWAP